MWSEEQDNMDNRIRKAADSMPHPIDDKHWEKMEMLLNEHLPEEKKRRRFLFILLLAGLLIGTGVVTMITFSDKQTIAGTDTPNSIPTSSDSKETKTTTNSYTNTSPTLPEQNSQTGTPLVQDEEKEVVVSITPLPTDKTTPVKNNKTIVTTPITTKRKYNTDKSFKEEKKKKEKSLATFTNQTNDKRNITTDLVGNTSISVDAEKPVSNIKDTQAAIAVIEIPASTNEEKKEDSTNIAADTKEEEKSKPTKKQAGKFSVLLSAGSDISGIGTKAGSPQIAYGIGIAYSLSDKLTLRTGLLAAVKKYGAKPEQYHPDNYNFWVYYPRMQKINADCFVYEIPLNVVYNFKTTKNHNWFVSTGLSSFIMKRETYQYTFKDNWGQIRNTTRTYKNEYKHWFSVLDISGGYQYHFSNRFSLLAEPYLKMPLAGVGFGHVKLNNAGILITAAIKPFNKKEK